MATDTAVGAQSKSEDVLSLVADKARSYVRGAGERRVGPSEAAVVALAELHEPFPLSPCDPMAVIKRLDEIGSAATVATTGGRYFGFVNGGMVPAALAANWLAGAWNQNAALRVMSPIAAELEEVVLRWICEALGLHRSAQEAWLPAQPRLILRRSSRHVMRSWRVRDGMSWLTGCLALRRSRWSWAGKCMRPCLKH